MSYEQRINFDSVVGGITILVDKNMLLRAKHYEKMDNKALLGSMTSMDAVPSDFNFVR